MFFYLLVMSFPIFFILTQNNKNKNIYNYYFILIFFILFFIVGFRSVGSDYQIYLRYYYSFYMFNDFKLSFSGDLAYDYLNYIFTRFNFPFYYLTATISAIFFISLYFFLKQTANPWLGLFISMPFYIFNFSMSAMRQSLAFSLFLIAVIAIQKNKLLISYIFIFMGILFHKSLVFFAIIPSIYKKITIRNFIIFIILLSGVFFYRYGEVMRMIYEYILKSTDQVSNGVYLRIIPIILSIALYFCMSKYYKHESIEEKNIIQVLIFLSIFFLFLLPLNSTVADRLFIYAGILQIFINTRFASLFEKNKKIYLLIILCNVFFYYGFYLVWAVFGNVFMEFKNYSPLFVL